MKKLKFRFYDKTKKAMQYLEGIWNMPDPGYDFDEIQQFTGLVDRLGKEIYEGDIVKCENGNFEVKWGHFTNNVNSDEYSEAHYGYYIGEDEQFEDFEQIWNANLFEVIGNIYENKDLLN